ncbi:GyrI-like domain-containing protein [Pontibacillus marinus]|uniref:AraC effector-binding domain-containing protein n=1 Tax=Pontibacillus marinus BH030004 = DSM 16465 TaxID=1385511 RepID=A0A0A5FW11_9BACI|nr:GyrI-like domain-containing protein [Pontibacillus marinus]KGX83208.1 hypothetical protein N783_05695 [Pontibacillus marinus BH030004 = DSM 16465]
MEAKIIEKPGFTIVGMKCDTTMKEKDEIIPKVVDDFHMERMGEVNDRINAPHAYGVFIDPPNWDPETEPFTWITAVEVESVDNVPEGMISKTIPAHTYATVYYDPKIMKMNPYIDLHRWINEQGYTQIEGFGFEVHTSYEGDDTPYTLHLPVQKG